MHGLKYMKPSTSTQARRSFLPGENIFQGFTSLF